jgi:hypothetical protein
MVFSYIVRESKSLPVKTLASEAQRGHVTTGNFSTGKVSLVSYTLLDVPRITLPPPNYKISQFQLVMFYNLQVEQKRVDIMKIVKIHSH